MNSMSYFQFFMLCFTSLFTMINPLSVIPVYVSMTENLDDKSIRLVAFKATLTGFITLIFFAFSGQLLFSFFGISLHSLRMVGGVLFFIMGYDMLQAKIIRTKTPSETITNYTTDIAITPLGIPMLCGPGSITATMVLMKDSHNWNFKFILLGVILFVWILSYFILVTGERFLEIIGENGNKVLTRLMGLILMVIAVEFFFSGLNVFVKEWIALLPK